MVTLHEAGAGYSPRWVWWQVRPQLLQLHAVHALGLPAMRQDIARDMCRRQLQLDLPVRPRYAVQSLGHIWPGRMSPEGAMQAYPLVCIGGFEKRQTKVCDDQPVQLHGPH